MTFDTRLTWEKLILELRLLRNEDFGALVPLCLGIEAVLWPKDANDAGFRHLQFMNFEVLKAGEALSETERWDALRKFLYDIKGFQLSASSLGKVRADDVLMKRVLDERIGHPLAIVLLILHLAHVLDLPITLLHAKHHFVLKWVRSGQTTYMDLYRECHFLTDGELIQVLNRSSSNLETWSAKQLVLRYLKLLAHAFRDAQSLPQLHMIYNLMLELEDDNTQILGERALLRQRLGFKRDALADLKRYFSFIDHGHAPVELRQAWMELEGAPEPPPRGVQDILH